MSGRGLPHSDVCYPVVDVCTAIEYSSFVSKPSCICSHFSVTVYYDTDNCNFATVKSHEELGKKQVIGFSLLGIHNDVRSYQSNTGTEDSYTR